MRLHRFTAIVALAATAVTGACSSGDGSPTVAQPGQAQAEAQPQGPTTTAAAAPAAKAGSWKPGQYKGPITRGYKGDEISFTVADDGRTISDIVFNGNWKCTDGVKLMDVGHVPDDYAVNADGTWGGEQHAPYLLWTVSGAPDASDGGTGTIRIEYDTECDTYKLDWTAARQ